MCSLDLCFTEKKKTIWALDESKMVVDSLYNPKSRLVCNLLAVPSSLARDFMWISLMIVINVTVYNLFRTLLFSYFHCFHTITHYYHKLFCNSPVDGKNVLCNIELKCHLLVQSLNVWNGGLECMRAAVFFVSSWSILKYFL